MAITLDGTAGTTTPALTNSALTSGRVTYAGTSGVLQDSSALTFDGSTLTVNTIKVGLGAGSISTNTAVGLNVITSNSSGLDNTAIGSGAMTSTGNGSYNTAVGVSTLTGLNGGIQNTACGRIALGNVTTGTGNTGVGHAAGYFITTGTYNTFLGWGTYPNGNATGNSNEMVIGASGTPTNGKGSNTGFIFTYNGSAYGSIYQGNNSASWATTSDQRIKKNIVNLSDGLNKINALRVVEFDYKQDNKHEVGFIAQEFEQVFPDQIVRHEPNEAQKEWVGEDKVMGVQQNLVPFLVKAIQELTARLAALESK